MKKLILISILISLISCKNRNFNMRVCSGDGFSYTETWIECDSFQMKTLTEAEIWVDGHKMKIIGNRGLRPETN
jgi:hypothetical protein